MRTVRQYRGMHVSGVAREEPAHVLDQSPHCVVQVKKLTQLQLLVDWTTLEQKSTLSTAVLQSTNLHSSTAPAALATIPAFPDLLCLSAFSIPHIRYVSCSELLGWAGERSQLCSTDEPMKQEVKVCSCAENTETLSFLMSRWVHVAHHQPQSEKQSGLWSNGVCSSWMTEFYCTLFPHNKEDASLKSRGRSFMTDPEQVLVGFDRCIPNEPPPSPELRAGPLL